MALHSLSVWGIARQVGTLFGGGSATCHASTCHATDLLTFTNKASDPHHYLQVAHSYEPPLIMSGGGLSTLLVMLRILGRVQDTIVATSQLHTYCSYLMSSNQTINEKLRNSSHAKHAEFGRSQSYLIQPREAPTLIAERL